MLYIIYVVKSVGITAEWVYVTLAGVCLLSLVYAASTEACIKITQYICTTALGLCAFLGLAYVYASNGGDNPSVYILLGLFLLTAFICSVMQSMRLKYIEKDGAKALVVDDRPADSQYPEPQSLRLNAPDDGGPWKALMV